MTTPISIRNVTKRFGATIAVNDVSLEIGKGQLFFLLGPSGCGKTTLLRAIAGFNPPESGSILFAQRDVTRLAPDKRNTGMVFQSYALWPHMSVYQNVEFGLRARKVPKEARKQRTLEALRLVQMQDYAERKPGQLSGGQQQRIALARALVVEPDVLLLDEPLSNLDAKLRHEMRDEIKRVCTTTGITSIYVTHDQKEALAMADMIAVMSGGRIVQVGPPREIYERPVNRFVADFLGPTNFLSARIVESAPDALVLDTAVGRLRAHKHHDAAHTQPGAEVTALIRPESFSIAQDGGATSANILRGKRAETIYLGEMAQHWIDVEPKLRIRYYEMNPGRTPDASPDITLAVDPREVIVLPA